jgi:hypothetical protein
MEEALGLVRHPELTATASRRSPVGIRSLILIVIAMLG